MLKTVKKHKKTAVLEDELDKYITAEDRGLTLNLPSKHASADVGRKLNPMRLAEIRKCSDCENHPVVLLTKKAIPVCAKHWGKLADAQISWSETG